MSAFEGLVMAFVALPVAVAVFFAIADSIRAD